MGRGRVAAVVADPRRLVARHHHVHRLRRKRSGSSANRGGDVPCAAHDTSPPRPAAGRPGQGPGQRGQVFPGDGRRPPSVAAAAPWDEIPPRPAAACRASGAPGMTRGCDPRASPAGFWMASVCGSRRHPWWCLRTPADSRPEGEPAAHGTVGYAAAARARPGRAADAAAVEADAAHVRGPAASGADGGGGEPPGAHGSPPPLAATPGAGPSPVGAKGADSGAST